MKKPFFLTVLLFILAVLPSPAQSSASLQQKIQEILSGKEAKVGVSILGSDGREVASVYGEEQFPMQSVFKFHIALAVLSQVDQGNLSLDQKIKIRKKELLPGLYSPLREKYPKGASLPLSEILEYTVSQSDNVGCDVLLKLMGGPSVIEAYFTKNHFKDISIKINEEVMQGNWDLQFQNWTTPKAATEVLRAFYDDKQRFLSPKSYDFIWRLMKQTETGKNRLKGQLPEGSTVAHKTGWSGTRNGITAAVNDIGIVFLPNGSHYVISVFVTNSRENFDNNERIIADIARAAWDFFMASGY